MPPLPRRQPKATVASSPSSKDPGSAGSNDGTTPAAGRPLKISIIFDDDASARSAEVLVKYVASDFECDQQSFAFDELDPPGAGVAAARSASDADILVVAVRNDRTLPDHMQLWLGLCLGLRDANQAGALVVLIAKAGETADPDAPLLDYLKTVAAIGGLTFFPQQRDASSVFASNRAPLARQKLCPPDLKSSARICGSDR